MGLGDKFKSIVLTKYEADTKQMRSELKKLSGDEKKRHQAAIDQADKENEVLNGKLAMLAKVGVAVGAAVAAYKVLDASFETYAHNAKLNAATVGVDLEGLQKATNGLVDETRLLEFASKAMNGTFKLSQKEMESALRGTIALRNEGNELNKTLDNVEKALTEGTVEPLKELGHVIKGVENDTREGLNAALGDLRDTARNAGPDLRLPGDEMRKSQIAMADSVDNLENAFGKLAVSLAPVVSDVAELVSWLAQLIGHASDINSINGRNVGTSKNDDQGWGWNRLKNNVVGMGLSVPRALGIVGSDDNIPTAMLDPTKFPDSIAGPSSGRHGPFRMVNGRGVSYRIGRDGHRMEGDLGGRDLAANMRSTYRKTARGGGKQGPTLDELLEAAMSSVTGGVDVVAPGSDQSLLFQKGSTQASAYGNLEEGSAALASFREEFERMGAAKEAVLGEKQNFYAAIFGTPEEISLMQANMEMLSSAFGTFTDAFGAGIEAFLTGEKGIVDAMKDVLKQRLVMMASEMGVKAIQHGAMAVGSLAFGDVRGAAQHGQAAAMFAGGAILAGGAAKLAGAGSAPSTAGAAGVGRAGRTDHRGQSGTGRSRDDVGSGGSTRVVLLDEHYSQLSPRHREALLRERMRRSDFRVEGDVIRNV